MILIQQRTINRKSQCDAGEVRQRTAAESEVSALPEHNQLESNTFKGHKVNTSPCAHAQSAALQSASADEKSEMWSIMTTANCNECSMKLKAKGHH